MSMPRTGVDGLSGAAAMNSANAIVLPSLAASVTTTRRTLGASAAAASATGSSDACVTSTDASQLFRT